MDTVLIANEMADGKRSSEKEVVVFKIDFEKTYGHIDLACLDHALEGRGLLLDGDYRLQDFYIQ